MNQVNELGRLTRDPETRYSAEGKAVSRFTLAVNMPNGKAEFFPVVAFDKLGEFCEKHLKKGRQVVVSGSLHNNDWEKDGQKHRQTEIIAKNIYFADSKPQDAAGGSEPADDGFMNIPDGIDEELPFN